MISHSSIYWATDHPVLEVLRRRRAESSSPGARLDGHKVGLAVEGGGMRGVVSGGMLAALEELGLTQVFDVVYGCSSGAVNSAFFLTPQVWYALSIYYEVLTTRDFVDLRRMLFGRAPMNLAYLMDTVLEKQRPLDYDGVLSSPVEFRVLLTDVDDVQSVLAGPFHSKADLQEALRGSCWLPVAVKGTSSFRGRRVIDGGVLGGHPSAAAEQDGCTHILSLSTRPLDRARQPAGIVDRYVQVKLERLRRTLGDEFLECLRRAASGRRRMAAERLEPKPGPYILDLAPVAGVAQVKRHELDMGRLLRGARDGFEVMTAAVSGDEIRPATARIVSPVALATTLSVLRSVPSNHEAGS
jgi:predicted patatin/cPLA2 family phospholipase